MSLRDRSSIARASWWPRRLTTRVTVATIIIVVLAGLVTLTILNGLLWYHLRAELLTTGDMLVEATGESLANALIDGDLVAIQETLDSATRNRDVVYAFAFAPQTPIIHTFASGFPADLLQLVDTTDEKMVRSALLRTDAGLVRDFSYRPLDGLPAEVHLGISQAHIGTVQRQLSIFILGLTAGGGLVAAAVAFAFSRIAIQPLATLTRQAQRLGKGYLDERLDLPAGDEVGDLAQAFNRMAADIQQTVQQLQASEAGYRDLLTAASAVGEGIALICDEGPHEGQFLFVNEAFARLAGYEPDDLLHVNAASVLHPQSLETARNSWRLIRTGQGHTALELILVNRQGQSHILETAGTMVEYEGRRALAWFARDVSERKAREEEVRRRNRELTALNAVAAATSELIPEEAVLKRSLAMTLEALDLDAGWIIVAGEDGAFRLAACEGLGVDSVGPAFPTCRCGAVIHDGQPRIIPAGQPGCLAEMVRAAHGASQLNHHATVPLRARGRVLGVLSVVTTNALAFTPAEMTLLTAVGQQIGTALENARLWQELRDKEQLRGELLGRVIGAQEDERQRIARELHDGIGQSLNALVVGLNTVTAALERTPPEVPELLRRLRFSASDTVQELQTIIYDLRPSLLDDLGLSRAVRWYAEERLASQGITVFFDAQEADFPLSSELETGLFRIAQEAITNIAKHARARRVEIRLGTAGEHVIMEVIDNGSGFVVSSSSSTGPTENWGLLGMRERATLLGGELTVTSEPDQGTRIAVTLPLAALMDAPEVAGDRDT